MRVNVEYYARLYRFTDVYVRLGVGLRLRLRLRLRVCARDEEREKPTHGFYGIKRGTEGNGEN